MKTVNFIKLGLWTIANLIAMLFTILYFMGGNGSRPLFGWLEFCLRIGIGIEITTT